MDVRGRDRSGVLTASFGLLLLVHLVTCQYETRGTQAPSFNPLWHTPVRTSARFSNQVPWTSKDDYQGQEMKSQGQKATPNAGNDWASTTAASLPGGSMKVSTHPWERVHNSEVGIPGVSDSVPGLPGSGLATTSRTFAAEYRNFNIVNTTRILAVNITHIPSVNTTRIPTVNTTHIPTVNTTHIPTDNTTHMHTVNTTHIPTVNTTHIPTVNTTHIPTDNTTHMHTVNTTHIHTVNTTHIPTDNTTHIPTVNTTHIPTDNTTHMHTVNTTHIHTVNTTHMHTVNTTHIPTVNTTRIPTVNTTHIPRQEAENGGTFSSAGTQKVETQKKDTENPILSPQPVSVPEALTNMLSTFRSAKPEQNETDNATSPLSKTDSENSSFATSTTAAAVYDTATIKSHGDKVSFYTAADFDKPKSDDVSQFTAQLQQPNTSLDRSDQSTGGFQQSNSNPAPPTHFTYGFPKSSFNFPEANSSSRDGVRFKTSPLRSSENQTLPNTTGMKQNGTEPMHIPGVPEHETLTITKIEDLQKSKLDSELLFQAVATDVKIANSTGLTEASNNSDRSLLGIETKGTMPMANSSDVKEVVNGTREADQFHLPDDDCLYDVYGTSGTLKFPDVEHFPGFNDKEFVTCRWRVRVPDGPNIKLSVKRLALSLGVEQLEIAVGMDGELKKRTVTGSKTPRDLVTMGTKLWLTARVRNDGYNDKIVLSFQQSQREAEFPVEKNYTCGAILTDLSGNITSPGYPDVGHYSNNQECSWYIVGPSQSVIRLIVQHFSTDVYDHVTMGIGLHAGASNSKLLTLYGQLKEQRETVIPANSLWIHFTSDDSDTDAGFFLTYQVLPRDICNNSNILTAEEGVITSVDYPRLYPINSECTWYIRAPPDAYVNITFFDLYVEDGRDFVLIGEGEELFSGPFMTFSGNNTGLNPMRLDSSDVWVHFTSDHLDGDLPYKGFSLSYQVLFNKHKVQISSTTIAVTTSERPEDDENMVLQEVQMNDQGQGHIITIPLTGVKDDQLDRKLKEFRTTVARLLNKDCSRQLEVKCETKHKLTGEAISVVGTRQDQGRLLVEVRVKEADGARTSRTMAATDYEELERLFHSDLQSLDLQDEDTADRVSSHLPEWLIGVIVVVILLIVAFFAMVIYSLMKERKKNRAGSYGGTTSTASVCEDLEVGKTDGNIRITAFTLEQGKDGEGANGEGGDGANGAAWTLDSEVASTLQRRQHGVSGCMNPAFIDDDAEKEEEEDGDNDDSEGAKKEEKSSKPNGKKSAASGGSSTHNSKVSSGSKSCKTPKGKSAEEVEMNGNVGGGKGSGHENGSVVKQSNEVSKEPERAEQETEIDGKVGGANTDRREEPTGRAEPEPSTSCGPRQLEVVLDRDPPHTDPGACVTVHMDNDDSQSDQQHVQESSTDEKEDGPGMSTNL